MLQGKKPPIFEHGFKTPKGKLVYLECSVTPLFDDSGNIKGSLGIARDITDKRIAQKELEESKQELENLVNIKDEFLSIIAHDLRDPFNILIGYSDLILDQIEDLDREKLVQYIQTINISSNNAFNLLNNLLDWSKSESNKIAYHAEEINISKTINNIIASLNYAAAAKHISIRKEYEEEITVTIDENMLKTVLRNLVGNAIKFSYKNSDINIEIVEEKLQFVVNIIDTGIGIKEENLSKIFSPEFDVSIAGTGNERGTGLGLKICKEFITKWGGRIWVESTYGNGSTFSFSIPR
jgi:signal transduction histidine kinase